MLSFLNMLISSGAIDDIIHDSSNPFSSEIFRLTKLEIKGHKKLYKMISSISVFAQLLQVSKSFLNFNVHSVLTIHFHFKVPELNSKVLSTLSIFLGLPHVHMRKCAATKLYEALIVHSDVCGIDEENLDEVILSILINSIPRNRK